MEYYKILCFKSEFAEFKNHANDFISEMSADNTDEFALVMATNLQRAVGFGTTAQGDAAIKALVSKCYSVDIDLMSIKTPLAEDVDVMPRLLFRGKDGKFERLVQEHKQYDKDLRKHNVISRHRPTIMPKSSMLASILQDQYLSIIGRELYEALNESCHYILRTAVSGEHGRDAFFAFSKDLDFFFREFKAIVGTDAKIQFVKSARELVHC